MADRPEELLAALDRLLTLERPALAESPSSDPAAARALGREARVLNEAGRYAEALEVSGRIEGLGADAPWLQAYKGVAFRGLGRWMEAFRCFERSLQHDPSVPYSWFMLADCLRRSLSGTSTTFARTGSGIPFRSSNARKFSSMNRSWSGPLSEAR